jgi:glycosyltransferase involved in cell wall biosynthesis
MKKLLIEASVLEQDRPSGVNYFTDGLARALEAASGDSFTVGYFWLNFLGRKTARNPLVQSAQTGGRLQQLRLIPQRVYAKLVYYRVAPPLPLRRSDWVIYPNFYIWPSLLHTKRAAVVHDMGYARHPEYVEDKNCTFLTRVVSQTVKKTDKIITISQFTTNELVELLGVPREKIITINIPVDNSQLNKGLDHGFEQLQERYGLQKKYILSLGTIEPRKNLELLIDAYCALPNSLRDTYSLLLAGKWGWKTEGLKQLVEQKRLEGYDIITPGHIDQDDRATFYYQASVFAITTHYEGFGMPLLEALHCGIPSVAVDIPVLREVADTSCLWVEKSVAAVSEGLAKVLTDEALRSELSVAGPKQSATFSWQRTANLLVNQLFND